MRKQILAGFMVLFIFPLTSTIAFASAPPNITAKSAIVIEASTGKVLYAKGAEERRYPASTTKMMTLIIALENGNLNDMVTTSPIAAETEGSSLWLTNGEKLTLENMLYGMMLISGNDATVAVAEHIAGSVDAFSRLMTKKAQDIGALNTNFVNSSGLPNPLHYSTAHDLAKIAAYGYKNPIFSKIVGTRYKIIPWAGKDHDRELYNENKLLAFYDGGNGVKTGYTEAAGPCLVAGANRGGIQLVAVVLDSDAMWLDTSSLLDYGFQQIKKQQLFHAGEILKTVRINNGKTEFIPLITGSEVSIPIAGDEKDQFRTVIDAPAVIDAPIKAGQPVGTLRIYYHDTEVSAVSLLAKETVEKKSFFRGVWSSLWSFFTFFIRNFA